MEDHTRKIALVTGANKGLGFEISKQLAQKGIRVILGARDAHKGREACEKLKQEGLDVDFCLLDVNSHESIDKAVRWLNQELAELHILVNNAGVLLDRTTSVLDVDFDTLSQTLQTNLYGAFLMCQVCIPLMKESNYGRIVNMSSTLGSFAEMSDPSSPYLSVLRRPSLSAMG